MKKKWEHHIVASYSEFAGVFVCLFLGLHLSLAGNSGHLTWVRLQQPQQQRYPVLPEYEVLKWLPTVMRRWWTSSAKASGETSPTLLRVTTARGSSTRAAKTADGSDMLFDLVRGASRVDIQPDVPTGLEIQRWVRTESGAKPRPPLRGIPASDESRTENPSATSPCSCSRCKPGSQPQCHFNEKFNTKTKTKNAFTHFRHTQQQQQSHSLFTT